MTFQSFLMSLLKCCRFNPKGRRNILTKRCMLDSLQASVFNDDQQCVQQVANIRWVRYSYIVAFFAKYDPVLDLSKKRVWKTAVCFFHSVMWRWRCSLCMWASWVFHETVISFFLFGYPFGFFFFRHGFPEYARWESVSVYWCNTHTQARTKERREAHFPSLSVHMLILFLCKCANTICMSKCLIFHSASILISPAVPLMEYCFLRYVPFIILFYLHSSDVPCRVSGGGVGVTVRVGGAGDIRAPRRLPEWDNMKAKNWDCGGGSQYIKRFEWT